MHTIRRFRFGFLLAMLACCTGSAMAAPQWYKGVTHVHSLWSDGDAAPEMIADWYVNHGYQFLCFSEHNSFQEGERYAAVGEGGRVSDAQFAEIVAKFGADWPDVKTADGDRRMRLKTFDELSARFDKPGQFLLVKSEEITTLSGVPHVNGINLLEPIKGMKPGDMTKIIQAYIDAVREQSERTGKPMLAHVNHLNFADGITAEEMIKVKGLEFFEVYNGHSAVHSWGRPEKGMPSGDRHWDIIQSVKQLHEPGYVLYGLATDDSHEYHEWGTDKTNPGRGWIMVYAEDLSGDTLVRAMKAGHFYSSTGVSLKAIRRDAKSLAFDIDAQEGVHYVTQFIGTRKGFDASSKEVLGKDGQTLPRATREYSESVGEVLFETTETTPVYTFTGDEMYVRARVVSDRLQPNPHEEGDFEMAWIQPAVVLESASKP